MRLLLKALFAFALCIGALATWAFLFEPLPFYTSENMSLDTKHGRRIIDTVPRARLRFKKDDVTTNPFVGIAISGGGSRAANFAAASLYELEQLGFLPHVTALSSVSGGSVTAAHHALFYDPNDENYWPRLKSALRKNFFADWVLLTLMPHNLLRLAITDYDRSDVMASVFNYRLFKGAKFGDLGNNGPKLYVNATEYTISGTTFPFVEYRFSQLRSKLSQYPMANAVMASGAFPFVFSGVTLTDHSGKTFGKDDQAQFLHLYDGGPADNLGIETILSAARSYYRMQRKKYKAASSTCFIFVIDAYQGSNLFKGEFERNPQDLDSNTMDSASTLLIKRRYDLLDQVGFQDLKPIYFPASQLRGYIPVRKFRLFQPGRSKLNRAYIRDNEEAEVECLAWHINNDRLIGMTLEPDLNSLPSQLVVSAKDPDRFIKSVFRQESSQAFSLIETHYKLTGPKNCSAAKLQSIIFDVAHILVREDAMPLGLACAWFNENNLQVSSEHCSPLEPLKKHLGIKFDYVKTKPRDGECLDVR